MPESLPAGWPTRASPLLRVSSYSPPALALSAIIADSSPIRRPGRWVHRIQLRKEKRWLYALSKICVARARCSRLRSIHWQDRRSQNNMNQFAVLDGLVVADLCNKAATVMRQTLPSASLSPAWIAGAKACPQTRSFALHHATLYELPLQLVRGSFEESCRRTVDPTNPPAGRVKEQHRNWRFPHAVLSLWAELYPDFEVFIQ